jgi:hypothetical protein
MTDSTDPISDLATPTATPDALVPTDLPANRRVFSLSQRKRIEEAFSRVPPEELLAALELSDDHRAERLLSVVTDAKYSTSSFATICRAADIHPRDAIRVIVDMYKTDSELRLARKSPEIMEALAADATPQVVVCPMCYGLKEITPETPKKGKKGPKLAELSADQPDPEPITCPMCAGRGTIIKPADQDARKLALDALGFTGKNTPTVAIQQNFTGTAPDMSKWSRNSDAAFEEE